MRRLRFVLPILGFALVAIPASATITYTSCSSGGGCSSSSGSYADIPSESGATGLAFSSPITFVSAGLAGTGIYTDTGTGTGGTGTVFTNYSSGGSVDSGAQLKGSSFVQGFYNGTGSGMEIDLPTNTYAFAMTIGDCTGGSCGNNVFDAALIGLGTHSSNGANYSLTVNGSTVFFGIVSDSPITSLFLTSQSNAPYLSINSFEIGQQWASPTPEAGTFFTMGGGLLGLYFLRRARSFRLRALIGARIFLEPRALLRPRTPIG